MNQTWIKRCVNEQGETVVEELIAEAVEFMQLFPTWDELKLKAVGAMRERYGGRLSSAA